MIYTFITSLYLVQRSLSADCFLCASGKTNQQVARQLGLTNATVGKWRRRFLEQDVTVLHDELRPGRPRPVSDEHVAPSWFARRWRRNRKRARTGVSDRWHSRRAYQNRRSTASGRRSGWNHTGNGISSSSAIHFS